MALKLVTFLADEAALDAMYDNNILVWHDEDTKRSFDLEVGVGDDGETADVYAVVDDMDSIFKGTDSHYANRLTVDDIPVEEDYIG